MYKTCFFYLVLGITLWGCQQDNSQKLTVATAANMQFAIKALIQSFTAKTGIECETIISSSGKLTAQIREGAPFDVFVSADTKYPTDLFESGLTKAAPEIYAYGKLVLWSMRDSIEPSLDILTEDHIKHIALPNPKTAPYGVASSEVLRKYGIYDNVEDKLVFGESVGQTNLFISSGAVEIGFTAKAGVLSPSTKGKGQWQDVDSDLYTPIAQSAVIIKGSKGVAQARAFYDFLFSAKGQAILKEFGYSMR